MDERYATHTEETLFIFVNFFEGAVNGKWMRENDIRKWCSSNLF